MANVSQVTKFNSVCIFILLGIAMIMTIDLWVLVDFSRNIIIKNQTRLTWKVKFDDNFNERL